MGRAARPLHDAGNHRSVERGSDLQAARRCSLSRRPNSPEHQDRRRSYTTARGTIPRRVRRDNSQPNQRFWVRLATVELRDFEVIVDAADIGGGGEELALAAE